MLFKSDVLATVSVPVLWFKPTKSLFLGPNTAWQASRVSNAMSKQQWPNNEPQAEPQEPEAENESEAFPAVALVTTTCSAALYDLKKGDS
jgi:hypothetical protein